MGSSKKMYLSLYEFMTWSVLSSEPSLMMINSKSVKVWERILSIERGNKCARL